MFTLDNEPESQVCPNDIVLQLVSRFVEALNKITTDRGLSTFKVVCDETNNNFVTIDEGQLIVDIYLEPTASMMEDYIFPSPTEGKRSRVETLPEPDISDLQYFSRKLAQTLKVPDAYLDDDNDKIKG